jgi:hypothetical protein
LITDAPAETARPIPTCSSPAGWMSRPTATQRC